MTSIEARTSRSEGRTFSAEFSDFVDLSRHRAETQPLDRAYVYLKDGETETGTLTYQALDEAVRAIAVELRRYVEPGERVLLAYPSGLDFIAAFYGCLYADVILLVGNVAAAAADADDLRRGSLRSLEPKETLAVDVAAAAPRARAARAEFRRPGV